MNKNKFYKNFIRIILIAVSPLAITAAHANELEMPKISGSIAFELQNDWVYNSDDKTTDVNTVTGKIEPSISIPLTPRLSIETELVIEQVQATDANKNTILDNEGAFIKALKMIYTKDNYSIFGGKFSPTFGSAWDLAPGLYGDEFAKGYETEEKIGFGGSYTLETEKGGNYTLTANTYFADITLFSESTITARNRTRKKDGGITNTGDFSSASITMDGENLFNKKGLNAHLGYRSQSEGDVNPTLTRENGWVAGVNYTFNPAKNVEVFTLAEVAQINNTDNSLDDMQYTTASIGLTIDEKWNTSVSFTSRNKDVSGAGANEDDHIAQFSAGYTFSNDITLDLGYKNFKEAGISSNVVGGKISYGIEF